MRSEAEIRKQVEARLRRWALVLLNVILFVGVIKGLALFTSVRTDGLSQTDLILLTLWASLIGLHVLRTVYIEVREIAVRRAVVGESKQYQQHEHYEKRKHDDALLRLGDDGELIDFPLVDNEDEKSRYER